MTLSHIPVLVLTCLLVILIITIWWKMKDDPNW